jgi:integrase/recombinase XerC
MTPLLQPSPSANGIRVDDDGVLVERYLQHVRVQRRLAERTVELYSLDLARLLANARAVQVPLVRVHTAHVRGWAARMNAAGRSGRGIALILSGWRGFYRWLGKEGLISVNPVQDVKAPKSPKPLPKALGVDESVQLAEFKNERNDPWLEARDAAMVEVLYGAGLRLGELLGLDMIASPEARGWVDLQEGQAHVLGKGSKWRDAPLGASAVLALTKWLAVRQQVPAQEEALFLSIRGKRLSPQSVWERLRARSLAAGMQTPVHPHMLRHSFASHVLQSSGDLRAVQELLGHKNIQTTQVYTRLDFQHLAKAYDAAHPRANRKPGTSD